MSYYVTCLRNLIASLGASLLFMSSPATAQSWTTLFQEDFTTPVGQTSPGLWSCSQPTALPNSWFLGNAREAFQSSAPGNFSVTGGTARLWESSNGANGGYITIWRSLSTSALTWRITSEVRSNSAVPERPVPATMNVSQTGISGLPCPPLFGDAQTAGWWLAPRGTGFGSVDYELLLRDPVASRGTLYEISPGSGWHTVRVVQ